MTIRWNGPRFDEGDIRRVAEVLNDDYVSEGSITRELEDKLEDYLGVRHVVMTSNGTAALFLAFRATALIRRVKEYEIIVPDMTMIATASAVGWAGGTPVLADVESARWTLDVEDVKKKITPKTIALAPVHILGRSCDMRGLEAVAGGHDLAMIEDAAGALGSRGHSGHLGTLGDVGCYSLQSNKIITGGQGGFVATDDLRYFETMRRLKDFGRLDKGEFVHRTEGYNLKMGELSAALALGQFGKLDARRELLISQRKVYEHELRQVGELTFPEVKYSEGEVPLWVDVLAERRNELSGLLEERGIATRDCWPAIHRNPPYAGQFTDQDFPVASKVADEGLWLPNGPSISEEDIRRVCREVKGFYANWVV